MSSISDGPETILIVDDEEAVRRTFHEWLEEANLGCRIMAAADGETALRLANEHTVDLAILDWNLGAGNDGLQLLEDLTLFNADVVAIMITGFAHQATPLDAMRMGVRDYLDKNHDLDRSTFLHAVRKQLERIRPARRQRQLHHQLVEFRSAVEKVLPLVQAAAALHDPVPLPAALNSLFRFLVQATGATEGVLLVRSYDPDRQPAEIHRVYRHDGQPLEVNLAPFARSIASSVLSMQESCVMENPDQAASTAFDLHSFERGRRSLLAAPLNVSSGIQAVIELFDKQAGPSGAIGFTDADRRLLAAASEFGSELLRHALAEHQTHRVLFDAVAAALGASESMAESLREGGTSRPEDPPAHAILESLQEGLRDTPEGALDAEETLRLAEAIRVLALRHGSAAVHHCTRWIESTRQLLDQTAGLVDPLEGPDGFQSLAGPSESSRPDTSIQHQGGSLDEARNERVGRSSYEDAARAKRGGEPT